MIFCYYTIILNPRLSIILCLSSGDKYLSLGISLLFSFVTVSELFCCEFFGNFLMLLAIKSPVVSAVFWMTLFEEVSSTSVADCLTWWRSFDA